jgi:hypothetical protein
MADLLLSMLGAVFLAHKQKVLAGGEQRFSQRLATEQRVAQIDLVQS